MYNWKELPALTLAGPTRDNPVLDPIAVQHLNNWLHIKKIMNNLKLHFLTKKSFRVNSQNAFAEIERKLENSFFLLNPLKFIYIVILSPKGSRFIILISFLLFTDFSWLWIFISNIFIKVWLFLLCYFIKKL